MKVKFLTLLFFFFSSALSTIGQIPSISVLNSDIIQEAHRIIGTNQSENRPAVNQVTVFYFYASDQKPLPDYRERLDVTLKDVSRFYQEEFARYGIKYNGIPFEQKNKKIVFHTIKGLYPTAKYNRESGMVIQNEIYNQLNREFDFSKNYAIIIHALCDKDKDGSYSFHAPYSGRGGAMNGVCHVADCEMLCSKNLRDTTRRMIFSEMFAKNKSCTVAEFNSWYVGGIAHELGHIYGLPHDMGNLMELDSSSVSLMGMNGSRHYRDYLWNGKRGSFFTAASVFQMLSSPLFTQKPVSNSNHVVDLRVVSFTMQQKKNDISLNVKFKTSQNPYGVVALLRRSNQTEYQNMSYSELIRSKDSVTVNIGFLPAGIYICQLSFLFPDGKKEYAIKLIMVNKLGVATDFKAEELHQKVDLDKQYTLFSKMDKTPYSEKILKLIGDAKYPPEPFDAQTFAGDSLYLSDAKWENASVGWGTVARNYFNLESQLTFFLINKKEIFTKGLYAHSSSLFTFNLGGKWNRFTSLIGLRDGAHQQGSARFTVIGDGKVLYQSDALRVNDRSRVDVDISNVKVLEIKADGTEGHNHNSWAVWLNPLLKR